MSFDYSSIPVNDPNALYRWCNERYFGNSLPQTIPCSWNNRLSRVRGRMKHRITMPYDMRIELSGAIKNHPPTVLNVMVHEMVHVWQFHNHAKTHDRWYLDVSGLSKSLGMNEGHGPAFFSEMKRLNNQFSELSISVLDDVMEYERLTSKPIYGVRMIWMLGDNKKLNTFFQFPQKPTLAQREKIMNQILSLTQREILSVDFMKSQHQYMADIEKITKSFDLRRNYRLKGTRDSQIKPFMEHPSTEIIESLVPEKPLQANRPAYIQDLNTVCQGLAELRGMSLVGFAQMFCKVMPYLKSHGDLPTGPTLISGQCRRIPSDIVETIKEEWFKGTKEDIQKSDNVVNAIEKVSKAIKTKRPLEIMDAIETAWMRAGPKRITRSDFSECLENHAKEQLDKGSFEIFKRHLHHFTHGPNVMMMDKVLAQGYRSLDDSYARVLGHVVGAAISAGIDPDDKLTQRVQKMWDSPSKPQFQKTKTFEKAVNKWADMLQHPNNDEWRDDFECSIAKFGGRVDRKVFTQTVMVTHSQFIPNEERSKTLEASRNMLKSFEKIPDKDGQLAFEL